MNKVILALGLLALPACSEEVGHSGAGGAAPSDVQTLRIGVDATHTSYLALAVPEQVSPSDPASSTDWDLAFRGYEVFTNSGQSGPGQGGAFGPLGPEDFSEPRPPVPFVIEDESAGAFWRWWAYDGTDHVIYSRYHIYGVRQAGRYFKVQVLSYYGEQQGAPVKALYQLRYAEVTDQGVGATQSLTDVDASAGGVDPLPDAPSACLDMTTGNVLALTPAEASISSEWQLCFRRSDVHVNGELGGPGAVEAVDVDRSTQLEDAPLAEIKQRTADSELGRFDACDWAALHDSALVYQGDRITSAFATRWFDAASSPPTPTASSWYVMAADGVAEHMVIFDRFEGASDETPTSIVMRTRPLDPL